MRRRSMADFARQSGHSMQRIQNLLRRFVVRATDGLRWQVDGLRDEDGNVESEPAEVFAGIGLAARPPGDGAPEAIVGRIGGEANHPAVIATRDRKTEAAAVSKAGLEVGATLLYNAVCQIKISASATIELGKLGGPFEAVSLAEHRHTVGPLRAGPYPVLPDPTGVSGGPKIETSASNRNSQEVKVS